MFRSGLLATSLPLHNFVLKYTYTLSTKYFRASIYEVWLSIEVLTQFFAKLHVMLKSLVPLYDRSL